MNLNRATIIGNLTRDPELRTTPTGQNVCSFSVATSHVWKDAAGVKQEKTEYHNCVAWGKLAEICGQYLGKGRKVYVEGRLQTRDWVGQDGVKKYRTEIIVENMIMLDRAPAGVAGADLNAGAGAGVSGAMGAGPMSAPSMNAGAEVNFGNSPMSGPQYIAAAGGVPADEEIKVEDIPF